MELKDYISAETATKLSDEYTGAIVDAELIRVSHLIQYAVKEGKRHAIIGHGPCREIESIIVKEMKRRGFQAKYHTWKSNGYHFLLVTWGGVSLRDVIKGKIR